MSSEGPKTPSSPDDVRSILRDLGQEKPPGEREFAARLHRGLVAAGAPPTASWLGRLAEGTREAWQELVGDRPQRRSLLTGAVLGALVTALVFTLLSGSRGPTREAVVEPAPAPQAEAWGVVAPSRPSLRPSTTEHKTHTAGDRRPTRDRLGELGPSSERPHTHEKR